MFLLLFDKDYYEVDREPKRDPLQTFLTDCTSLNPDKTYWSVVCSYLVSVVYRGTHGIECVERVELVLSTVHSVIFVL